MCFYNKFQVNVSNMIFIFMNIDDTALYNMEVSVCVNSAHKTLVLLNR